MRIKSGAVVRALASHQFDLGSNPGVDAICGLSLLLVLSFAPRGFSPGTPVFPSPPKPTFPNSNSTRSQVDEEPLRVCAVKSLLLLSLSLFIIIIINLPVCKLSQICSKGPTIWLLRGRSLGDSEKISCRLISRGKNLVKKSMAKKN